MPFDQSGGAAVPSAKILSVASAAPPHVLLQSQVTQAARMLFADRVDDFDRLEQVFASTGIVKRHSVVPMDWFLGRIGWPERTKAYLEGADALFIEAANAALERAGLKASEVDTIVTVSSTGIATPSLEARVADRIGFRADAVRVPVFGLGCAGGVSGLSLAARLAKADPGSVVLMVAVELCTLSFRLDDTSKANLVATALFGDGAAACVIRTGEEGLAEVEATGEHRWPGTLDIMGWAVEDRGLGVIFDRSIPSFAEANLRPAVDGMLARAGRSVADMDRFTCHPGGTKVIAALETALELGQGSLDHERAVLAEFGNMSSPTALFVLERAGFAPPRQALMAMGPGFTASLAVLRTA